MAAPRDSRPLMNGRNEEYDESTDVRFAIDDEVEDEGQDHVHDAAEASDDDDNARPGTSRPSPQTRRYQSVPTNAQEDEGEPTYKYPPAAPPPSYREATGKSLLTHRFSALCHHVTAPDFSGLQRTSARVWYIICRFWPTSRFAQLGLFMAGLWLLVIVSGPAFEEAGSRAGAGYPWAGIDKLTAEGPRPITGDGHIVSHANWTHQPCHRSKTHHGEMLCTSMSRIELKAPFSFNSNEDVFILADPPRRDHLNDGRGRVPGTVEVKLVEEGSKPDQSPKGIVTVVIEAKYEQSRIEVFERTTVGKMKARFNSEGVGIYTYPLPAKYKNLSPPPLYMHIKVLVPAGTIVPALRVDASKMTIGAFTAPDNPHLPREKRNDELAESGIQVRAPSPQQHLSPPFFGRFIMSTSTTSIRAGSVVPLLAAGLVQFDSHNGDIIVASEINATEVRLQSLTGSVRIEEGTRITAFREAHLSTQTGNIEMRPRAFLKSSVMTAKTQNGGILGGDVAASVPPGIWAVNHTLELSSSNGIVHAAVAVHNISTPEWNQQGLVHVKAESKNGDVDLRFLEQESGPILQASAVSNLGAASARMAPAFIGLWELDGSLASSVTPPAASSTHGRTFTRKQGSKKATTMHEDGSITLGPEQFGHDGVSNDSAKSSEIHVKSSLGVAKLAFA